MKGMKVFATALVALMFLVAALPVMADDASATEEDSELEEYLDKIMALGKGDSTGMFMDLDEDKAYKAVREAALKLKSLVTTLPELSGNVGWDTDDVSDTITPMDLINILDKNSSVDKAIDEILKKADVDFRININECSAEAAVQFTVLESGKTGLKLMMEVGAISKVDASAYNNMDAETEGFEDGEYPMMGVSMGFSSYFTAVIELTSEMLPSQVSFTGGVDMDYSTSTNYRTESTEDDVVYHALSEPRSTSKSNGAGVKLLFGLTEDTLKNVTRDDFISALEGEDVDAEIGFTLFREILDDRSTGSGASIVQMTVDIGDLIPEEMVEGYKAQKETDDKIVSEYQRIVKDFFNGKVPTMDEISAIMESLGMDEIDPAMEPMIKMAAQSVSDAAKALKDNLWDNNRVAGYYSVQGTSVVHENVKSTVSTILKKCKGNFDSEYEFDNYSLDFIGMLGVSEIKFGAIMIVNPAEGSKSVIIPSTICGEPVSNAILFGLNSETVKTLTLPSSVKTIGAGDIIKFAKSFPNLTTIVAPGLTSIQAGCLDASKITLIVTENKITYTPGKTTTGSGEDAEEIDNVVNAAWLRYDDTAIVGFQNLVFADGKISGTAVPQNDYTITGLSVAMGTKDVKATVDGMGFSFAASANTEYTLTATSEIDKSDTVTNTDGSVTETNTKTKNGVTEVRTTTTYLDGSKVIRVVTTDTNGKMTIITTNLDAEGKEINKDESKGSVEDDRVLILKEEGESKVVEATIKKASISLSDIDATLKQKNDVTSDKAVGMTITIDAKDSSKDGFATLANAAVKKVADSEIGLTIETDNGSFVMSPEVGAKLAENSGIVSISIKDDNIDLSENQKAATKGKTVYDLELLVGDKKPADLGGLLEFKVKYILGPGESADRVIAEFIDDDGKIESVNVEYDEATSMATIYTPHCSVYALSSSADGGMGGTIILIAILAIVIVAGVLVYVFRDKLFHGAFVQSE